ncbi:protein kinase [Streptomyces sp. NPDC005483]|uniref:serine/threonine-protein kinase n=1 Tax=Streptomyces sp. NPDC005483 TaxID=3154882 RepID=UPI0033B49D11
MTGRYRLVESIGQGGMGRVWRAADEVLDRQVAVKEMRIDGLDAEDTRTRRERTLREARATARIDHPNVVRVYDVVDEGERLWIVMELVKGRSLERMTVEDGPLGPSETALLGLGLVRALRQVHARGVLHRDIKPGNVLVESGDRTGRRIVLTDFGIAAMQDAEALTMVGMLVGSPDYMAPERVSGRPQGPPSDIWSLGATLCAALGGRSPFSRDTTLATLHAVLYEEPELPAAAGPLADILTALLEKDPSIRPGLDEVESALHTVAFQAPTPTLKVGPAKPGEGRGPGGDVDEADEQRLGEGPGGGRGPMLEEEGSREPGVEDPGRVDSARVPVAEQADPAQATGAGREDRAQTSEEVPVSEQGGTSAPSWAQRELRNPSPERPSRAPGPGSSETPAYLGTRLVRAVRDPRVPEPESEPERKQEQEPEAAAAAPAVVEPSDAVPVGHTSSGTPSDGAQSVAEGAGAVVGGLVGGAGVVEPSDAVPVGHTSSGTPSDGAQSVAEGAGAVVGGSVGESGGVEPSDAVPPGHASSGVAGDEASGVPPGGSPAVAEGVAAQPVPPTPAEPFSTDRVASASTEAASEERSEAGSETPSGSSVGAALRAGATTTSTPLASAPTLDSLSAGAPTEHFPMPEAPTRDTPGRAASAPTRVGPVPPAQRRSGAGVSLVRGKQAVPDQHPGPEPDPGPGPGSGAKDTTAGTGPDPAPGLVLGPHPHRMPPGELPGPARPAATPHRGRRRTALVAVGSVVATGAVVVAIILATTSGSPGADKAGGSPSASASVSASEPGASTPVGTPASTVEGTSRPRSLPPGAHEEAGGFAWATPTGWRRDVKTGAEVHYTSPDGQQELAAKSSLARGDLMETWRTSEQNAHQGQDYRKIRLEETTFRDHPAVVWEYTFTLNGVPWHAQLLGFNVVDKSYQINTWYQPEIETQALHTYEKVKESFTIL